jgi:hypothetical protein
VVASGHANILRATPRLPSPPALANALASLERFAASGDAQGIRAELERLIPDAELTAATRSPRQPRSGRRP